MREPFRSELVQLLRQGAGTRDIHDVDSKTPFVQTVQASDRLVRREIGRVDVHRNSLNPLLEQFVGSVSRILDVGCGTGATTVAMALSDVLAAHRIVGVDPDGLSIKAATVRAKGYAQPSKICSFVTIAADARLPFRDRSFDLVTCVSVVEYVHLVDSRRALLVEITRVTRQSGHLLIVIPSPFRVRDYHTGRVLGDWRRTPGYPWASPPWQLRAMLHDWEPIPVHRHQVRDGLRRRGLPWRWLPNAAWMVAYAFPWQRLLFRRR